MFLQKPKLSIQFLNRNALYTTNLNNSLTSCMFFQWAKYQLRLLQYDKQHQKSLVMKRHPWFALNGCYRLQIQAIRHYPKDKYVRPLFVLQCNSKVQFRQIFYSSIYNLIKLIQNLIATTVYHKRRRGKIMIIKAEFFRFLLFVFFQAFKS